jgi:hypothetical protein
MSAIARYNYCIKYRHKIPLFTDYFVLSGAVPFFNKSITTPYSSCKAYSVFPIMHTFSALLMAAVLAVALAHTFGCPGSNSNNKDNCKSALTCQLLSATVFL